MTLLDKVQNFFKNQLPIVVLIIISICIIGLAETLGAFSYIKEFLFPNSREIEFSSDDYGDAYRREANPRFGFSFIYPKLWDRIDPDNGDGNTFINPKNPEVKIYAWGNYYINIEKDAEGLIEKSDASNEIYYEDTLEKSVAFTISCLEKEENFKLLKNIESGKDVFSQQGKSQIEGRRLEFQYSIDNKMYTFTEVITQLGDTEYHILCQAPSDVYPEYEDLFLNVVSSLSVIEEE